MVLNDTLGLLSGVAVGAYAIGVGLNGNALPLWAELKTEGGYLYFLGSLFAIGALHKFGPSWTDHRRPIDLVNCGRCD